MSHELFSEEIRKVGFAAKTGGNQSFILMYPEIVWYIARGYADVFSTGFETEIPVGSRSYMFTAGQGELLFGISSSLTNARGLIAVPSADAEVIRIGVDEIKKIIALPGCKGIFALLLDQWVHHLSLSISKDINPRTDRLIESGGEVTLEANLKVRSKNGIVWIGFNSGNALFIGMKEVMEPESGRRFPVSQDSWLQTMEPSTITLYQTGDICLQDEFQKDLGNFYEVVFFCELFNTRLGTVDEFNRLNEKAFRNSGIRMAALLNIASVINNDLRKSHTGSNPDPLLSACRFVADFAGILITEPNIRKGEETPALTLNDILHSSRFKARKVTLKGNWWQKDNGSLLAFTKNGKHPVALIPKPAGRYQFICPGENIRQPLTANLASTLESDAHQFYRPFPDQPVGGLQLVRFGLKSCYRDILLVTMVGFVGGALTLLVPVITGNIFDAVIPQADHRQLFIYAMVIFFSLVAIGLFQLVRSYAMIRIETKLDYSLQSAIWDRLLNLPVPFFRQFQAGELAAKANSIMLLRKMLSDTVVYSVLGAIFMLFNLFLLFFYDAVIAVWVCGFLAAILVIILNTGTKIRKHQGKIIQLQNNIFGMLIQVLSSISKIRIAGTEVHVFAQWATKFSATKREAMEVRKLLLFSSILSATVPMVITLFVFGVIAGQIPDSMSTGEFMAFNTALTMSVVSLLQIGMAGISFFMAIPQLENIRPILESMPENVALKADMPALSGEIEVANVCFRYQPDGPLVLKDVSLHIYPGEFVAIVGASGSGKSTLLRILLGFETPESGSVYYDRQDISTVDPASVRRQVGTVLQNSQLSAGTILSNITGLTSATFEDAWEAAHQVDLSNDIKSMPMGMHTVITGGLSTISGGQRQRIMIARAIVNKPRILFFDEATSALDNKTQLAVSLSLEKLQATRVIIAHRLTTIQHADRICLMNHGAIEEVGTYRELLGKGGKFTDLVQRQMLE